MFKTGKLKLRLSDSAPTLAVASTSHLDGPTNCLAGLSDNMALSLRECSSLESALRTRTDGVSQCTHALGSEPSATSPNDYCTDHRNQPRDGIGKND